MRPFRETLSMTLFSDREHAFEEMFAHDQEARFRALARRNRMLGEWAAERLGLKGDQAAAYRNEIGRSVVASVVDESLVKRIAGDFEAFGLAIAPEQIREKMAELMTAATEQVRATPW
ncbi:DUF1476 domain-containing protein [Microvirga thermotolerans]|nr:DUF1476 domain-containing protein [Microvirga thermotolerans]